MLIGTFLVGCGGSPGPRADRLTQDEGTDNTQAGSASKSSDGSSSRDAPSPEDQKRLALGPFSFAPPRGWETRETPEGLTCFAPERAAWREAGFRPNLGLRKRPHPGVSLERHRDDLDQLFAQSARQVNRQINDFAKRSGEGDGKSVELKETSRYTLTVRRVDGAKVLSSTFVGVFQLPTGLIATKTHGIQIIESDALYTISLTFPRSAEAEMDDVWKAFERDLRIKQ
jgi:hypothetical protein